MNEILLRGKARIPVTRTAVKRIPSKHQSLKHYYSSSAVLLCQTPSHTRSPRSPTQSPRFHILSLSSTPYMLEWYRQGLSVNMALWPPRVAPALRQTAKTTEQSSCSLLWKEKPESSRLPTLGSLIHVARLRISDSSSVSLPDLCLIPVCCLFSSLYSPCSQ